MAIPISIQKPRSSGLRSSRASSSPLPNVTTCWWNYHDTPSWTFRFNHPRGGQASLGVSCDAGETASIYSSWHVDDYDRFTRSIHWRKSRKVSKDANALLEELELELSAILAVPLGQWNQVADDYASVWGRYTKDEFEKLQPSYPDPI
jgi:hypothetical protein